MKTGFTKKQREQAALICAVSASADLSESHWYWDIAEALGIVDGGALTLAADALCSTSDHRASGFNGVPEESSRLWSREDDALAEALIREGWNP